MAQSNRVRTIVGRPMTPDLLVLIGGLESFPATPPEFDPAGAWVNKYRIHTCHGYYESSNKNLGVLRLEREPGSGGEFTFKVRQRLVNDDGTTHVVEALARCRDDELAAPVEWRLLNWFEDISGAKAPETEREETGRIDGPAAEIVYGKGEQTLRREGANPLTSDWNLFAAVQRLPFEGGLSAFNFLEGFSLLRENHQVGYRGLYTMEEARREPMHWFQQTGAGVLPYDYWLDGRRRLLCVATHARAYVLDDAAEELVAERLEGIRKQRARRRNG